MKIPLIILGMLLPNTVQAQEWRPCGGSNSDGNRFVPQGWKGADFRSACAKHDAYYKDKNSPIPRAKADKIFLNGMLAQAKYSSQPVRAKIVARNMYRAVRLFGRRSYQSDKR